MHQYGNPVTIHRPRLLCSASLRLQFHFSPVAFQKNALVGAAENPRA
jgi:hypothetical protein